MAISLKRTALTYLPGGGLMLRFMVVLSGTYPTGGETLDFATDAMVPGIIFFNPPEFCSIVGQAGFVYQYWYGTGPGNGKIMVRVNNTAGANSPLPEHTNAAYVAGVSGDTIRGLAIWK